MNDEKAFRPGVWKHYRGGVYFALGLVTHHDTRKPMVIYLSEEKKILTVRPLRGWKPEGGYDNTEEWVDGTGPQDEDGWLDPIGGKHPADPELVVERFKFVRDMTPQEFSNAFDALWYPIARLGPKP